MRKRIWIILIGVFLFPVINLVVDKPADMAPETLQGKTPLFKAAAPVFRESCLNCHSQRTQFPWYASLPIAKQLIQKDIKDARKEIDLEKELFTPGKAPAQQSLNRISKEIKEGAMPPIEYKALHWKAILSPREKQAILDWIREQQGAK